MLYCGCQNTYRACSFYTAFLICGIVSFYIALISLEIITKEVIENLGIDSEKLEFVSSSTVYEENNATIVVATSPRMNPTSKHIAGNYYFSGSTLERNL